MKKLKLIKISKFQDIWLRTKIVVNEDNTTKNMNTSSTQFAITSSIPTTYDVCILILIYFHVSVPNSVPLKLFLRLISSTAVKSTQFNTINRQITFQTTDQEPLFPDLDSILQYILSCPDDTTDICMGLCRSLKSIKSIDQLLVLQSLLDIKYKSHKSSYLGNFVDVCSSKFEISTFDDRITLLNNLDTYLHRSQWAHRYSVEIATYQYNFISNITSASKKYDIHHIYLDSGDDSTDPMIDTFKTLIKQNTTIETRKHHANDIFVSETHLQNLINYQIQMVNENKDDRFQYKLINEHLGKLSLNDITGFPSIHILNYFKYTKEQRYQDALNALHSYYDYMFARNADQNFHISLLHLGLFHLTFNDSKSPMAAFEEAFKIARENRDIKTLNYIHLAILKYMEDYPNQIFSIRDQINKIINSFQKFDGQNNSQIFEGAYRADALLSLKGNKNLIKLLETNFQYLIIALQQDQYSFIENETEKSVYPFYSKVWKSLGYKDISDVYATFHIKDSLDEEIENGFELLREGKNVDQIINNKHLPSLKYDQEMRLSVLSIKHLIAHDELDEALEMLNRHVDQCVSPGQDNYWKFQFMLQTCQLFIDIDMGQRILPTLAKMINETRENQNPLQSAQCLLALCQILVTLNKTTEVYKLLKTDLDLLLQFNETKTVAVDLFISVAESLMMA